MMLKRCFFMTAFMLGVLPAMISFSLAGGESADEYDKPLFPKFDGQGERILLDILKDTEDSDEVRLATLDILGESTEAEREKVLPLLLDILEDTGETDDFRLEVLNTAITLSVSSEKGLAPILVNIIRDEEESYDVRMGVLKELKNAGAQLQERVAEEKNATDDLSTMARDSDLRLSLRAAAHGALEAISPEPVDEFKWRSRYYPEDWEPGYSDEEGRFLHDFSYAGYHKGEKPLPDSPPEPVVDVTESPYNADPSGENDSTEAIQNALDTVGEDGGGTVYLPEGTYRVNPPGDEAMESLLIQHSGVVLRGDGPGKTHIYNSDPQMRSKSVIRVQSPEDGAGWREPLPDTELISIVGTVEAPATEIPMEDVEGVKAGQWVILTHDVTEEFVDDNPGAHEDWASDGIRGFTFYRRVTELCEDERTVTVDIPIRFDLKSRDNARLYRIGPHIEEVGIENLSIGMQEHPGSGFSHRDYGNEGTAAYEVHGAFLIIMQNVVNGWVRRVHSYCPPTNRGPHHMLSNGIMMLQSRNVTISECDLRHAQYRGWGGNGYGYEIRGNDCLIQDCAGGDDLRYVYDFKTMESTGNVIHRCKDEGNTSGAWKRGSSDFHMHLSASNLIDNLELLNDAWFNAAHRGLSGTTPHALTTDQSVFWNTRGMGVARDTRGMGGEEYLINVRDQSGRTFIIGTRGERTGVRGLNPEHRGIYFEGEGLGDNLRPQSLYEDQLERRIQPHENH